MVQNILNIGEVQNLIKELNTRIQELSPGLIERFPIEKYLDYINYYPKISSYKYVSEEVENYCNNILQESNSNILELYHRILLLKLIVKNYSKVKKLKVPEDVKEIYFRNFIRIVQNINIKEKSAEEGFYLYPNDKFFKDLGVCTLRIIPAGVIKMHLFKFPKSVIFRGGIRQFFKGLYVILFQLRGTKPIFEMHADSHDPEAIGDWSYEGWVCFYRRAAKILEMNPEVKGVFGIGWPFDPVLEQISPRHVYLRTLVTENGGSLFFWGYSEGAVKSATYKSPTRRKLYEEGKYCPADYMIVWPRKELIYWAKKRSK